MSPPVPDRALRRLVVDLAALHADDLAAVLGTLESDQRRKVEGLLHEFSDFGFGVPAVVAQATYDPQRFTPWLAERLNSSAPSPAMTEHGRSVLRAIAVELYPASSPRPAKSPTLRQRLGAVGGGRRAS